MEQELKKFINCPNCKTGHVVHAGDHYYCNTDNNICDFMIKSDQYDAKITKNMMVTLIKNRFLEPMFTGLNVYKNSKPVNGFIVINKYNKVDFCYPNYFPIVKCPKCREKDIIMKYSERNDSLYYGCMDYKECKLTLPYMYREKPFKIKDIKTLCQFKPITKEFVSKAGKKYTANVSLDKKYQLKTSL